MDGLIREKNRIETVLQDRKSLESDLEFRAAGIQSEIREKANTYNSRVEELGALKAEYKDKMQKFSELQHLVSEYKNARRQTLAREYRTEIQNTAVALNSIVFDFKLGVFKKFNQFKAIPTGKFPNLSRKKNMLLDGQKHRLRKNITEKIKEAMGNKTMFNDLIFYINFLIKYEIYFREKVFVHLLFSIVESKFEYHFLSDRDSNRLDKPEWVFDFLLHKCDEMMTVFGIYKDCSLKQSAEIVSEYSELFGMMQDLLRVKIKELSESKSTQKRKLIFHFASEFIKFRAEISKKYGHTVQSDELGHLMSKTQRSFVQEELSRIHELRYVQWFREYQTLCRDSFTYLATYSSIDKVFRFDMLTKLIVIHTRAFLENLRFINREEVRAVCFIFSELIELKEFVANEENELLFEGPSSLPENLTTRSLVRITALCADILKLIRDLALNDTSCTLRKLGYFNYVSAETKRNAIVKLHRIVEDYKRCVSFGRIEKYIVEKIDRFFLEEIMLKVKFSSEEYLEFRDFYKNVKKCFSQSKWEADLGCQAIDALFDGRKLSGAIFKDVQALYNAN